MNQCKYCYVELNNGLCDNLMCARHFELNVDIELLDSEEKEEQNENT